MSDTNLPIPTEPITLKRMVRLNETHNAYDAFKLYCRMGRERSLDKVRIAMDRPVTSISQFHGWSSRFSWVARSRMYDELDEIQQELALQDEAVSAQDLLVALVKQPASKVYQLANKRLDDMLNDKDFSAKELKDVVTSLQTIDKLLRTAMGIEAKANPSTGDLEETVEQVYVIGGNSDED